MRIYAGGGEEEEEEEEEGRRAELHLKSNNHSLRGGEQQQHFGLRRLMSPCNTPAQGKKTAKEKNRAKTPLGGGPR